MAAANAAAAGDHDASGTPGPDPGTELFVETADFPEDVLNGTIGYTVENGKRVYAMDKTISLYCSEPGTGEEK